MKPLYAPCLYEDLATLTKDRPIDFPMCQSFDEAVQTLGTGVSPTVSVSCSYDYVTDAPFESYQTVDKNGQPVIHECDPCEVLPVNVIGEVTIVTDDTAHIITLERYLQSKYQIKRTLSVFHPDFTDERIVFHVSLDPDREIYRNQGQFKSNGKVFYFSTIYVLCEGCYSFMETPHPVEVSFSKELQKEVMQKIVALNDLSDSYADMLPYDMRLLPDEEYDLSPEEVKLYKRSVALAEKAGELQRSTEVLSTAYSEPYFIKTICGLMDEYNCDVKTATRLFEDTRYRYEDELEDLNEQKLNEAKEALAAAEEAEREQRQQEKREEDLANKFSRRGDERMNIYTDAVISDLRSRMKTDHNVTIYGGSSYMDYCRAEHEKTLTYPTILVRVMTNFNLSYTAFVLQKDDGSNAVHFYDTESLPIDYGISVSVLSDDVEKARGLANEIKARYTDETQVKVPTPGIPGENVVIKLRVPSESTINESWVTNDVLSATINFAKHQCVYFPKEHTPEEIEYNQQLQLRMVQQAQFSLLRADQLQKSFFNNTFNSLFQTQKRGALSSLFFGTSSLINSLVSKEYKELQTRIKNRQPFDRGLFNSVFSDVVPGYPTLYDKTLQGWTVDQLQADIDKTAASYQKTWESLCVQLNIPDNFWYQIRESIAVSPRCNSCLINYIEDMDQTGSLINEAVENCEQKLWKEEKEQRRAEEEWEESRAEQEYVPSSSRGGFLGDIARTAAGVALGNKMSGAGGKRNDGKKDLFGTSVCQRCRTDGRYYTCAFCPAKDRCTQQH